MSTVPSSVSVPRPTAPTDRWRHLAEWERPAALLLAVVVYTAIQASTFNIIGIDGYYHVKVADLIRQHGPRLDFPWLRFTILNEQAYTDHHLLFHLLQAPLTPFGLREAAKAAAVLFAALGAWGCYLFMARGGVRCPLLWLGLLLAVSYTYLWRQSMARPQALAGLVIVAALWLTFERRLRWLIPLGVASAWLFNGFVLPLLVPALWLVARLALERRLDWRPLAYLLLGTALGLLLHPYFPHNLAFALQHLLPKSGLGGPGEVPVGLEWYPFSRWGFLSRAGPATALLALGLVPLALLARRRARLDPPTATLGLLALVLLAMVARSQRMIEYFPAFAVLFAARSWSLAGPLLPPWGRRALCRHRLQAVGLAALGLTAWLTVSVGLARREANAAAPTAQINAYRDAALWLADNSPPGALVFNTDWDDFPALFFWNSHNVYVVGLDLTYLALYDQELYRSWREISSGALEQPSAALRDRFGAAFVFSDTRHARFLERAAADPGLDETFRSPTGVVWRVLDRP